jgi:hypothetical protein
MHKRTRIEPIFIVLGLLAFWIIGGFIALLTVHWDSIPTSRKGHIITVWLMVAFAFVAAFYAWFMNDVSKRAVPVIIVVLLTMIEACLVWLYRSW